VLFILFYAYDKVLISIDHKLRDKGSRRRSNQLAVWPQSVYSIMQTKWGAWPQGSKWIQKPRVCVKGSQTTRTEATKQQG